MFRSAPFRRCFAVPFVFLLLRRSLCLLVFGSVPFPVTFAGFFFLRTSPGYPLLLSNRTPVLPPLPCPSDSPMVYSFDVFPRMEGYSFTFRFFWGNILSVLCFHDTLILALILASFSMCHWRFFLAPFRLPPVPNAPLFFATSSSRNRFPRSIWCSLFNFLFSATEVAIARPSFEVSSLGMEVRIRCVGGGPLL